MRIINAKSAYKLIYIILIAGLLPNLFISFAIVTNAIPNPPYPVNAPGRIMCPEENINTYGWIQRRARKRACTLSSPIINPQSILTWQGFKNVASNVDRVVIIF